MRRVRLGMNVTLDGYVAGANGELDWLFPNVTPAQLQMVTEFLREVDTILIGHVTYLEQAAYWPTQTGELADLPKNPAECPCLQAGGCQPGGPPGRAGHAGPTRCRFLA